MPADITILATSASLGVDKKGKSFTRFPWEASGRRLGHDASSLGAILGPSFAREIKICQTLLKSLFASIEHRTEEELLSTHLIVLA